MTIHEVHHGTGANIGHVGLALIAEMTRVSGLDDLCRKSTKAKQAYIVSGETDLPGNSRDGFVSELADLQEKVFYRDLKFPSSLSLSGLRG
jgi:hypothetical protein